MAQTELVRMEPEFIQELSEQGDTLPKRIRSQTQYQFVQSALAWFVGRRKAIKEKYAPFKRSQLDSLNLLRQGEKDDLARCQPYEELCQTLIRRWEEEREAKAQKELQAAMQKAQVEAKQQRDRQLAQLESEKAQAPDAEKSVLADVQQTLEAQPLAVGYTPVKQPYSRPQGHSVRNSYRAEVVNLKMLVQAVASGDADLQCLQPNMTHLNAKARQEKELLTIPGVAPVKTVTTVVTS
jgi:hypothetical protein